MVPLCMIENPLAVQDRNHRRGSGVEGYNQPVRGERRCRTIVLVKGHDAVYAVRNLRDGIQLKK